MSRFIRRMHMYMALCLLPWMLVYALATLAMNHRAYFLEFYGGNLQEWETENDRVYDRTFSADVGPDEIAEQILKDIGLSGPFEAVNRDDGSLWIHRGDPVAPRQITYNAQTGRLVVERLTFRLPVFLTRLHHRHGYRSDHTANDLWAVSVDLVVFAMVFWIVSGLWMWWELKVTRCWGILCLVLSFGTFGFFLFTI